MSYSKKNSFSPSQTQLARYAKALSHPARIAILETLAAKESCICGEIVEVLPLAQSTVSQHLKELKEAGLITGELEGAKSCYCIDRRAMKEFTLLSNRIFKKLGADKTLKPKKCC